MSLIKNSFFSFLGSILIPKKTKRLVFLTSLLGRLVDSHNPSIETMHKLNNLLGLCTVEDAMKLPLSFSGSIWSNKTPEELIIDPYSLSRTVNSIIDVSPKWLRYADTEAMVHDIETILKNYKSMETA